MQRDTRYDDLTERLVAEYELLLMAMEGRYLRIRAPGVVVTPGVVGAAQRDLFKLTETFFGIATTEVLDYLAPMLADATDELRDALIARRHDLLKAVFDIAQGNVMQISQMTKTGVSGIADLLKHAGGAQGLLVQARAGRIDFKASDTSGRRWPAALLFRVIVRDFAYQSYIDWMVSKHIAHDIDVMQTSKGPVPLESLPEVRADLFHPNARTVIEEPHVQA